MKFTVIFLSIILVGFIGLYFSQNNNFQSNVSETPTVSPVAINTNVNWGLFNQINDDKTQQIESLIGGIIPHHLVAARLINDFFTRQSNKENIKHVVFVTPNHNGLGNGIITTTVNFNSSFRVLKSDEQIIQNLLSQKLVNLDDAVISQEFAITTMVPFIAKYYPNALITPIIIKRGTNLIELENLANQLASLLDPVDCVILISVDAAHEVDPITAEVHDQELVENIRSSNISSILKYQNDYVDSPESIVLLLLTLQKWGKFDPILFNESDSSIENGLPYNKVTSYIEMGFQHE